ncbi:MAG: TRAP transporter small permease subunit [Kiloniellales bacterium]
MDLLIRIGSLLDRIVTVIAKLAAWAGVVLIAVTVFDVITRRFFVLGSTKLQEFEWHMHVVLFGLLIGYAYLKDAHVRIDLVRERLRPRVQWWLEIAGCLFFLLPYCALVIHFGTDFTLRSFADNEISASATGLTHRWIIKSVVPIGFALLGLAGLTVLLRKLVELFGTPAQVERVRNIEAAEVERLIEVPRDEEQPR